MLRFISFIALALAVSSFELDFAIRGSPYHASITVKSAKKVFGAAIVSPNCLVTSAAAVDGQAPGDLRVNVGSNHHDGGLEKAVAKIIVHKDYKKDTKENNCAIIVLKPKDQLVFTEFVQAIDVAPTPPTDPTILMITGMGVNKKYNSFQWGMVSVIPNDACKAELTNDTITDAMFCAKVANTNPAKGSCMLEFGGPASINNLLYGVLSVRAECKTTMIFTSLAALKPFIDETIAANKVK